MAHDTTGLSIRRMRRSDLDHAFAWSVQEGWNIGRFDHSTFYETDPNGFFLAEVDGEPVGSCSGVAYGATHGFVGIYIVRPEFRKRGCGLPLFQAAMSHLAGRTVGLDGVPEQQANYIRSGFQAVYRNARCAGIAPNDATATDCVPLTSLPIDQVVEFDTRHFFTPRPRFIKRFIAQPGSCALGLLRDGRLAGMGAIRPAILGYSIAPLFAETEEIADTLFRALCAKRPGEYVYMDVPEPNAGASALVRRYNFAPVFETARMYAGAIPELPIQRIYGVTTLELG